MSQQTDRSDSRLPAAIGGLPIGHLQLEGRAAKAAAPHDTIAALEHALGDKQRFPPRASGTLQIKRTLHLLARAVQIAGTEGWDQFRRMRPPFVEPDAIYFYSPRCSQLARTSCDSVLAKLHLSRRAVNALGAAGVATIGSFVTAAQHGIVDLRALGHLTAIEITEALGALADSVTAEGGIDWIGYAERRHFRILPRSAQASYSGREFLRHFPKVCEEAIGTKFGSAGRVLLLRRMFRHPDILVSFRDIGEHLGLTRQRTRLLENSIVKLLRRAIWCDEYRGCRFRFRPEFLEPLRALADRVGEVAPGELSASAWSELLRDIWEIAPHDLGQQALLLQQLLGIESELPDVLRVDIPGEINSDLLSIAAAEVAQFFVTRGCAAFSPLAICRYLETRLATNAPSEEEVEAILQRLPTLEQETTSHRYRLRIQHLKNHVDRCERVLRDHGVSMHFTEIHEEISRLAPETLRGLVPRDLASRMANTHRFVPVGRSGLWSLRDWPHIETGTVADVAAAILSSSENPLSETSLYDQISPVRKCRKASIGTLLREDARFVRVAPAVWDLATRQPGATE